MSQIGSPFGMVFGLKSILGLSTSLAGLSNFAVLGFDPDLVAKFDEDIYRVGGSKTTFNNIFTHSRLGNATMTDSDGLLKWAPHNLLTYSEDFSNAAWVNAWSGGVTLTPNSAVAPDGSTTADKLALIDSLGDGIFQTFTPSAIVPTRTGFFIKNGNSTESQIFLYETTGGTYPASLEIGWSGSTPSTTTASNASDISYTDFSSGWWLVEFTFTPSNTASHRVVIRPESLTSSVGNYIYIWGAHLYRSDLGGMAPVPLDARVAGSTTYVPTTSTAKYLPRRHNHTYNGSAWVDAGTLIEAEARTNLYLNSETPETQVVQVTPGTEHTVSFLPGSNVVDLDESIAITAVDVFVYDTTKDSDGGAWRTGALAQASSWYNEPLNTATRGARREFPAVAVIVAENNKVTIYDGDDPALPMWMVFNSVYNNAITSVPLTALAAVNGTAVLGTDQGTDTTGSALVLNFLSEKIVSRRPYGSTQRGNYLGNILQRNSASGWDGSTDQNIVAQPVNDVAMTVLPDAPIDPATGLPVPTIAVATDGGVSVIKDDGAVWDIYNNDGVNAATFVGFTPDNLVYCQLYDDNRGLRFFPIPTADVVQSNHYTQGAAVEWYGDTVFGNGALQMLGLATSGPPTSDSQKQVSVAFEDTIARGVKAANSGLSFVYRNTTTPANGMVAYTTSTYNTGWMNGDIKGAFLSDTDDTDLVASGELVPSSFASWIVDQPNDATVTEAAGVITITVNTSGNGYPRASAPITCVVGQTYHVSVSWTNNTTGFWAKLGTAANLSGTDVGTVNDTAASGSHTLTFVATATTHYLNIFAEQQNTGSMDVTIASQSVKLADPDRSVNNNGLIVNGTVTRTAVATGADLVAYSGFSASNYLEQPYNSDLDFGTGDFCVMGWVKAGSTVSNQTLVSKHDGAAATLFQLNTFSGVINFYSSGWVNSGYSPSVGVWEQIVVKREAGTLYIYANGLLKHSVASTDNYTLANATTIFGVNHLKTWPLLSGGSLALWRISATAPTAEQIAKIYEDEKVLFQENAACTLYGASDAVTALAHDPDTDLLHVGTSAGRSVFSGLRRINNTTTAVTTAISATNGVITEQ